MTFSLIPENTDTMPFECNNSCWAWILCDTPIGTHLGVKRIKKNQYEYTPDKYGGSPLSNGTFDDDGNEHCFKVNSKKSKAMEKTGEEFLKSDLCKKENKDILLEFIEFAKDSQGFFIL